MSNVTPEIRCKTASEVRNIAIDFQGLLDSGELLTGTPTMAEVTTSDLTISNVAVNAAALTINNTSVAIAQAVQGKVLGGTAATSYVILVTATSDASPAQTFKRNIRLDVLANSPS